MPGSANRSVGEISAALSKAESHDENNGRRPLRERNHAAVLAFLIRYGKPQIDEPLSRRL